jgi:hypothetical protein
MKLFSLRLTTLKSKLYAIIFASVVVRIVVFFMLPNVSSDFGPDEGTYAAAAQWTSLGKSALDFPAYGAGLYVSGRSFLLPAALVNKIGLSPIDSVRFTSSLYGVLVVCMLTILILKSYRENLDFRSFIEKRPGVFYGLFLFFTFSPSHFGWSTLGLRESTVEFWIVALFCFIYFNHFNRDKISKRVALVYPVLIVMVFSARPQVGWVLSISLFIFFLAVTKKSGKKIILLLTAIGTLLGSATTVVLPEKLALTDTVQIKDEPKSTAKIQNTGETLLKNPANILIQQVDNLQSHHELGKFQAASAINVPNCPVAIDSRLDNYFCLIYRAPFTTFTFLFRPMLGADVTSTSSLFAGLENIFWLAAFLFIAIMLIRNKRLAFFGALSPSLLFFSLYSLGAGAYEGNMGTAFRHKSLILWVVLLLIASTVVATEQRKADQQKISGSSKE